MAIFVLSIYVIHLYSATKANERYLAKRAIVILCDSIMRRLRRGNCTPRDLFIEVKDQIVLIGETLQMDNAILDKSPLNFVSIRNSIFSDLREIVAARITLVDVDDRTPVRELTDFIS